MQLSVNLCVLMLLVGPVGVGSIMVWGYLRCRVGVLWTTTDFVLVLVLSDFDDEYCLL